MDIAFNCDKCGHTLAIGGAGSDTVVRCPQCGTLSVPGGIPKPKEITFDCNKCGQHIVIDGAGAGMTVQCPECKSYLIVPRKQATPTPPPLSDDYLAINPVATPPPSTQTKKKCPYCAEEILTDAIKCKHCGEFLNCPPKTQRPSPSISSPVPPMISKPITQKRTWRTGLIVGLAIAALILIGLFDQTCNSPSKMENQANTENTRRFTASFLRFSGLAGSTWIVESCEDQKNGTQTFSGSGYMIFVSPAPHATFKGSGFVTGDRLTFSANFTGYETLHNTDGQTIRAESWWPINED